MLESIASISSEMQNFNIHTWKPAGSHSRGDTIIQGENTSMQDDVCHEVPDTTADQGKQDDQ
eukprot:6329400-Prorocentrum_lima.AAC.1